jgi:hypothetical protein
MNIPLFDCNVLSKSVREASASSSASSRLPVIRLQKSVMPTAFPHAAISVLDEYEEWNKK